MPKPKSPELDIPLEERRRLFLKAVELGLKPSDLGISANYFYRLKKGLKPLNDKITQKIIRWLKEKE